MKKYFQNCINISAPQTHLMSSSIFTSTVFTENEKRERKKRNEGLQKSN